MYTHISIWFALAMQPRERGAVEMTSVYLQLSFDNAMLSLS